MVGGDGGGGGGVNYYYSYYYYHYCILPFGNLPYFLSLVCLFLFFLFVFCQDSTQQKEENFFPRKLLSCFNLTKKK